MGLIEKQQAWQPAGDGAELCRLCGAPVHEAFRGRVLQLYDVAYQRCSRCNSLQAQHPYWIEEAYASAIAITDTGAAIRNFVCHAAIVAVTRILGVSGKFLDFGGGTGLLCRMLRDRGIDAYAFDKYADPVYARGFVLDGSSGIPHNLGLLSAIEVFEHCVDPVADLRPLFAAAPDVLFATTIPYRNEGADWWYLGMETGQHVFFYSEQGLAALARMNGYHYCGFGNFHLFTRSPISAWRRALVSLSLSSTGLRLTRLMIAATQRGRYANRDGHDLSQALAAQPARIKPTAAAQITE
jgi:Methyltransferase domain